MRARVHSLAAKPDWLTPRFAAAARRFARQTPPSTRIVVATSGGPDSQALLWWSAQQRQVGRFVHLGAIGIDHGLRPEAPQELAVAEQLAQRLGLPFTSVRVQVAHRGNRLAQARAARYAALREQAQKLGATAILLGHTLDDRAETLMWHLLRGSGRSGFAAMPAVQGEVHRPLLGVTRSEILRLLAHEQIDYATDPSNLRGPSMRATLRQRVWPALEAFEPRVKQRLCEFFSACAPAMRHRERRLQQQVALAQRTPSPGGSEHTMAMAPLAAASLSVAAELLRLWLASHGVRPPQATLRRIARSLRAGEAPLACGAIRGGLLRRSGEALLFVPASRLPQRRGPAAAAGTSAISTPAAAPRSPPDGAVPQAAASAVVTRAARASSPCAPQPAAPPARGGEPRPFDLGDVPLAVTWAEAEAASGWTFAWPQVGVRMVRWAPLQGAPGGGPMRAASHAKHHAQRAGAPAIMVAFAQQRLHGALRWRTARKGETMAAWGRSGRLRIAHALADAGIPLAARPGWPVLTLDDEVIWLTGIRRGDQATIDDVTVGTILVGWANPTF